MISLKDWQNNKKRKEWFLTLERKEQVFIDILMEGCPLPICCNVATMIEGRENRVNKIPWPAEHMCNLTYASAMTLLDWHRDEEFHDAVKRWKEVPNYLELTYQFIEANPGRPPIEVWDWVIKTVPEKTT